MSIEVTTIGEDEFERWNELVDQSQSGTFFHYYEVLEAIERNTAARLHPLIGYKGQEPVGIFPVFEVRKLGVGAVFSPPPGLQTLFLGPLQLNERNMKQRKLDKRRKRFTNGCVEWIDDEIDPRYFRFATPVEYEDIRSFSWNDFTVAPRHTYHLDIDRSDDELKSSFSRSLRNNLNTTDPERYDVTRLGTDGIRFIYNQISSRYQEQGLQFRTPLDFLLELFETLPDGAIHPYVASVDGERVSGVLVFEDFSTAYFASGGGKPDVDLPINDILHWQIIRDARDRGAKTYDMYGADSTGISDYKAQFNPDLRTYYDVERSTMEMKAVSNLYKRYYSL
jgi:hypothetical protein